MALWTAIADYRGGTYISQVRAVNVTQALLHWAEALSLPRGSLIGMKTRSRLLAAARDPEEKALRIEQTRNVWIWTPDNIRPSFVVHLVKTAIK